MNSQVHATLRRFRFQKLSSVLVGLGIIIYALIQLRQTPSLGQVLLFILVCMGGMVLLYSAMTLLSTLSFWLVRIRNLDAAFWSVSVMARYPIDIFEKVLRNMLTFFLPLAFIATVPARGLARTLELWMLPVAVCFALGLMVASRLFWRKAARIYTSAGG